MWNVSKRRKRSEREKAEHNLDESHIERNWDAALVLIHAKRKSMDLPLLLLQTMTERLQHLGMTEEHPLEYM